MQLKAQSNSGITVACPLDIFLHGTTGPGTGGQASLPFPKSTQYVPHRPILANFQAKFRQGFLQLVCPGYRGTVR